MISNSTAISRATEVGRWKPRPRTRAEKKRLWRWIYLVTAGHATTDDAGKVFGVTSQTFRRWTKDMMESNSKDVEEIGLRREIAKIKEYREGLKEQ